VEQGPVVVIESTIINDRPVALLRLSTPYCLHVCVLIEGGRDSTTVWVRPGLVATSQVPTARFYLHCVRRSNYSISSYAREVQSTSPSVRFCCPTYHFLHCLQPEDNQPSAIIKQRTSACRTSSIPLTSASHVSYLSREVQDHRWQRSSQRHQPACSRQAHHVSGPRSTNNVPNPIFCHTADTGDSRSRGQLEAQRHRLGRS
jgi:hypothetical protein